MDVDSDKIYHKNIIDKNTTPQIRKFANWGDFQSLAIDWNTGNVYVPTRSSIMVYNHRRNNQFVKKIQYSDAYPYNARSLAIHPNRGYIFVIALRNSIDKDAFIYRMSVDGSTVTTLASVYSGSSEECGITVDYSEDMIYWVFRRRVQYMNLEGGIINTINITVPENPRSISVYHERMYISNLTSIWRLDKKTGESAIRVAPKYGNSINQAISGVKIYI